MGFRIGRFGAGFDGVDIRVETIDDWSGSGQEMEFNGVIHVPNSVAVDTNKKLGVVAAMRQQLLNYKSNFDEPLVPLYWDEDVSLNGYYSITDVSVSIIPNVSMRYGLFAFSIKAFRTVQIRPAFEWELTGDVIPNDHSLTGSTIYPWASVPVFGQQIEYSDGDIVHTRVSSTGSVYVLTNDIWDRPLYYHIDPDHYYDGACAIESPMSGFGCDLTQDGNTMIVVGNSWQHKPDGWRISNGLIRIYPTWHLSGSSLFGMQIFDGSNWSTEKTYRLTGTPNYGILTEIEVVAIVRNSPEEVTIRLGCVSTSNPRGGNLGRKMLSITLRRGSRMAECHLATDDPTDTWQIRRDTAEAATAVTGGIRATADDVDGDRYVIATSKASTNDLTNGGRTANVASRAFHFGVGVEVAGSGATTYDQAQHLVYQFLSGMTGKMMLSGRSLGT